MACDVQYSVAMRNTAGTDPAEFMTNVATRLRQPCRDQEPSSLPTRRVADRRSGPPRPAQTSLLAKTCFRSCASPILKSAIARRSGRNAPADCRSLSYRRGGRPRIECQIYLDDFAQVISPALFRVKGLPS